MVSNDDYENISSVEKPVNDCECFGVDPDCRGRKPIHSEKRALNGILSLKPWAIVPKCLKMHQILYNAVAAAATQQPLTSG